MIYRNGTHIHLAWIHTLKSQAPTRHALVHDCASSLPQVSQTNTLHFSYTQQMATSRLR
jgi:hypothetical protein